MRPHRTTGERPPYMVKGNYVKCFGHLYKPDTMSPEFEKRMRELMEEDARYFKPIGNHYTNERKE